MQQSIPLGFQDELSVRYKVAQYKSIHQTGRDKESHAKQIINVIRKVENSQYARLLSGLSTPAARAIPIPVSIGPVCWVIG